ncbi:MAG TPA: efflux RND transporter periplasmic adaptor subunit [Candidatus Absconditabacterales bacterium]|nr:efflux RND transporter periplasmic adaptor subunit [Candidatus Absconditabacterales bacterium]
MSWKDKAVVTLRKKVIPFLRKYIVVVVLVATIGGRYLSSKLQTKQATTREIKAVAKIDSLTQQIKVVGSSELVSEQKLRFNQQGEITSVSVRVGDHIKKGDIIAELDSSDAINSIRQAEISLESAKIRLQEVIKGNTQAQILQARNDLASTQQKIPIAEQEYEQLLIEQANVLSQKKNDIALKEKELKLMIGDSQDGTVNKKALEDAYIDTTKYLGELQNSIDKINDIFSFNDTIKRSIYLSAKDRSLITKTEEARYRVNVYKSQANVIYETLKTKEKNQEDISSLFDLFKNAYDNLIVASDFGVQAVRQSIIGGDITQTFIDQTSSSLNSLRSQAQSSLSQVTTTLSNVDNASLTLQQKTSDYQNALSGLELTEKSYESKIESKTNEITNLKAIVTISEEKLKEIEDGATTEQLATAQNDVLRQELVLQNAQKTLDNYRLEAPFDGVVRKIDFKKGDKLVADEQKYVYLENPNLVQMTTLIDQMDIVETNEGQAVTILFDAYPKLTFTGTVQEVDSTPQVSAGVTSYSVTVTFDKKDIKIFGGMTAKMYIHILHKNNILVVPSSFITTSGSISTVLLLDETGKQKKQTIKTGMTDGAMTEITEGLKSGDAIVQNVATTTTKSTTSLLPTGGPRGQGGGNFGR